MARTITLCLRAHQPWALGPYSVFDTATNHDYFATPAQCDAYMALCQHTNQRLLRLLQRHDSFTFALNLTGPFLEHAAAYPEVIASFRTLIATKKVELITSPHYHTLSFFYSHQQFEKEIQIHQDTLLRLFGTSARIVANTELMYDGAFGEWANHQGFESALAEGDAALLAWRSPNYLYRAAPDGATRLLLRNRQLSDDLALRFGDHNWREWPLTPETYASWARRDPGALALLLFDYGAFGAQSGSLTLLSFIEQFVERWTHHVDGTFALPSRVATTETPTEPLPASWTQDNPPLTAWTKSALQREAIRAVRAQEAAVTQSGDAALVRDWRRLQTVDILRQLDAADTFLSYMNAVRDVQWRAQHLAA